MNSGSFSEECTPSSSTPVKSEYFQHAQNVAIRDNANFSTVHGDQIIHYNAEAKKGRFIVGTEEEEAEYSEFSEVKRGDVIASRNVYRNSSWCFDEEQWKWVEYEQTVVTGKVRVGGMVSKCTVASYSGEGAEEVFGRGGKKTFDGSVELGESDGVLRQVLDSQRPRRCPENAQLVATNLSRIPMLVLTGDLVPMAHLADQVGDLGQRYLVSLAGQMGCRWDYSLWMDTSRGVFCRGPQGPFWLGSRLELDNLPLDAELVKEDVLARYLSSRLGDRGVVEWLSRNWNYDPSRVKVNRPTFISTLDDTILAVGGGVWREGRKSCLGKREELANGMTRFTLRHNQRCLWLKSDEEEAKRDWFAQAPSIFHAHGIALEDDLRKYKLVVPWWLGGKLSNSKAKRRRRRKCSPIYLFLSEAIFWSFDQDGQTPIPTDLCHHLGLPPSLSPHTRGRAWSTLDYKMLQEYQIGRKFDPTTTDFAQYNHHHIYDVVKDRLPSRFEEMNDSDLPESASAPQPEARTESTHHIEMELEDLSLELLFGDTTVKASSLDDTKRNGGRIVRKGMAESAGKSLAPFSTSQPARRAVSSLNQTSKANTPKPIRPSLETPAKAPSVTNPPEIATRRVVPSSQKPLSNGVKDAMLVPLAKREIAGPPRDSPIRTSTSTTGVKPERRKETGTHSATIPRAPTVAPARKPTSPPVFRTSRVTTIKTPTPASTSTAKKSASPSSTTPQPNPTRLTAKSATLIATGSRPPPSAPLQRVGKTSTTPLRNVATKARPQSMSLPSPGARTVTESRRITSAAVPSATTNVSSPTPQEGRQKTSVKTSERTPSRPPLRGAKPHVLTSSSRSRLGATRSRS
ncbi:hypothetical protein V5O48_013887 [Marasmius crinis-equi]|uniref:Uncharacterized protein n=1 Tax=Marasmius crinis-equi TaxID=585013 RepID=A0ABR3EYV2_9AGAR